MTATSHDSDVALFEGLSECYELVVAAASDGTRWAGTSAWLVKERKHPRREVQPSTIDKIVSRDFPQVLRWSDNEPPIRVSIGLCRIYLRPDDLRVHVKDELLTAIEAALTYEDFEGVETPPDLELRQGAGRLDPIGLYENGDLVAVVMPAKYGPS